MWSLWLVVIVGQHFFQYLSCQSTFNDCLWLPHRTVMLLHSESAANRPAGWRIVIQIQVAVTSQDVIEFQKDLVVKKKRNWWSMILLTNWNSNHFTWVLEMKMFLHCLTTSFFKLWDILQIMFLFQWWSGYYFACYFLDFTWEKVTFIPWTGTEMQTFREYKTWVYPAIMWMNCQSVYAEVTQWRAVETDIQFDLAFKKLIKYVSTLLWFILLSEKQYCMFLCASIVLIQLRRKTFMLNHLM